MANQNFRVKTGLEVGTGVTISAGIVTAVSFRGDGSALTGVAVTTNVRTNSLVVTGVSTLGNTVVGGGTTQLIVNGDARITGILTIGTSSITLDGSNNRIVLGTGTTISSTGAATFNNGLIVTGVITATTFNGNATTANTATYATTAGIATYSTTAGVSTYATTAGIATYSTTAGIATSANSATSATTATTANALNTSNNYRVNSFGVGVDASGTAGEIRATNNVTAFYSSDINLKTNIRPISDSLNKLLEISGVNFEWKDEYITQKGGEDGYFVRKNDVGVIAQEIEKVIPEAVATRDDGYKAVRYELIIPLLIEAIKEQQKQIDELKNR